MKSLLNVYFIFCFLNFGVFTWPGQASVSVNEDITENWELHTFQFSNYIDMNTKDEDPRKERHEYTIHRGLLAKMIKEQNDDISAVSTLDIIDTPVVHHYFTDERNEKAHHIYASYTVTAPVSLAITRNSNLEYSHSTCNLRINKNGKKKIYIFLKNYREKYMLLQFL